jgi:plasmid stability protein
MAQLVLKDIDTETAEKLDLRAKRLGTTPEEEASRLLRERLLHAADPCFALEREKEGGLMDLLLRMPNVGEYADFFRAS